MPVPEHVLRQTNGAYSNVADNAKNERCYWHQCGVAPLARVRYMGGGAVQWRTAGPPALALLAPTQATQ